MAVDAYRVTVATTATQLTAADAQTRGENSGFSSTLTVKNPTGGTEIFLGGPAVTSATGYSLKADQTHKFNLRTGDTVYAIIAAATQVVHVIREDV